MLFTKAGSIVTEIKEVGAYNSEQFFENQNRNRTETMKKQRTKWIINFNVLHLKNLTIIFVHSAKVQQS